VLGRRSSSIEGARIGSGIRGRLPPDQACKRGSDRAGSRCAGMASKTRSRLRVETGTTGSGRTILGFAGLISAHRTLPQRPTASPQPEANPSAGSTGSGRTCWGFAGVDRVFQRSPDPPRRPTGLMGSGRAVVGVRGAERMFRCLPDPTSASDGVDGFGLAGGGFAGPMGCFTAHRTLRQRPTTSPWPETNPGRGVDGFGRDDGGGLRGRSGVSVLSWPGFVRLIPSRPDALHRVWPGAVRRCSTGWSRGCARFGWVLVRWNWQRWCARVVGPGGGVVGEVAT
jgi:hypothetical protein